MTSYDVVVIGSGTGGQTAAYDLKAAGLLVAVAEKSDLPGGTCAICGCQAKKWYYEAAEAIAKARHLEGKGVDQAPAGIWPAVQAEKRKFTDYVPDSTVEGFYEAGIDFLEGPARFTNPNSLDVAGEKVNARFFVIATGARPMHLPFDGRDHLAFSHQFLDLEALPQRIVFVGGGFISFEFAHFAARLGPRGAQITILEAAPRPLGAFDPEMTELLVAASRDIGIDVRTRVTLSAVHADGSQFQVDLADGGRLTADLVVHGAGRSPDLDDLELAAAGVEHTPKGITVGPDMRTSQKHIYAVGDCAATVQLARVADAEAHVAARHILASLQNQGSSAVMDYGAVPFVLFTYPQLGMIGQTEAGLQEQSTPYRKSFGKDLKWPTYRRVGMTSAAYKILVGADDRILGAHFLSDQTTGMLNTIKQAMLTGTPAAQLHRQNIMSPYPSRESDLIYMLGDFSAD